MVFNGERQRSLTGAGKKITNRKSVDGWYFWEVKLPGDTMLDLADEVIE